MTKTFAVCDYEMVNASMAVSKTFKIYAASVDTFVDFKLHRLASRDDLIAQFSPSYDQVECESCEGNTSG
jgi:hypothetical protein